MFAGKRRNEAICSEKTWDMREKGGRFSEVCIRGPIHPRALFGLRGPPDFRDLRFLISQLNITFLLVVQTCAHCLGTSDHHFHPE